MSSLKVIFIDLDGTLINSLPFLFKAYKAFLAQFGLEGTKKEFEQLNGPSIPHVVNKLRIIHNLKIPSDDLLKQYYKILDQAVASDIPVVSGAFEGLEQLSKLGLKLVLVSSAHGNYARKILSVHEMSPFFSLIISPEQVDNVSKPDPAIYLFAMEKAGCHPDEGLAIEDSFNGVRSATSAGLFTLFLHSEELSTDSLVKPVKSWDDVIQFIQQRLHASI